MDASVLDYVSVAVAGLLTIVGLIVANSYGRQRRLKVSEHRIKPYGQLWATMENASSRRIGQDKPLTPTEAETLAQDLRVWYHASDGGGMLLPIPTLKMFFLILDDLDELAKMVERPQEARVKGSDCLVHISVLRTQLKIDLDIYDIDERGQLEREGMDRQRAFLRRSCFKVERWGRPDRWFRPRSFLWHYYTRRGKGKPALGIKEPC